MQGAQTRRVTIEQLLNSHGYIHRHDLVDRGWSVRRIRAAVEAERLFVRRRQWIVHPRAHASVHVAAAAGGHLTCASALKPLGLWRPVGADERVHLALASHSSSATSGLRVHRAAPVVVRSPRELLDRVENVLAAAARCFSFEDALAIWESTVHTGLASLEHLARVQWRDAASRRLAAAAGAASDSGLETMFVWRLHRAGIAVRQQVRLLGRPVDALIGDRLVVQIDGYAHHSDAAQRRADIAHDRALHERGYTVLRYAYADVVHAWPRVEAEILRAIAQRRHCAVSR